MKWEKNSLSLRQVNELDDNKSIVEWANEIAKQIPESKRVSVPMIVAKACKEEKKTGSLEAAKVKVANELING